MIIIWGHSQKILEKRFNHLLILLCRVAKNSGLKRFNTNKKQHIIFEKSKYQNVILCLLLSDTDLKPQHIEAPETP